jgi:hypothetical protein
LGITSAMKASSKSSAHINRIACSEQELNGAV